MKTIEIYCDGAALNNGCKNSIASYGIVILLIENGKNKRSRITHVNITMLT